MGERDPKRDPRSGDVLRVGEHVREVESVGNMDVVYFGAVPGVKRAAFRTSRHEWVRWAQDATVEVAKRCVSCDAKHDGVGAVCKWCTSNFRPDAIRSDLAAVNQRIATLAATIAARDERVRELEAEAEKLRDTAVSIELVKVASVDLVQDADGRDQAVLSTSWGIGLHRQHNCDEEGCGCWHVIARLSLSVESRAALLDLRSAKDDARRERDEARARIATMERELAAMRTGAEAAERLAFRERQVRASEAVSWDIDWQDAMAALLAVCPEKGGAG